MDNDQRDRREWPDSDTPAEPAGDAAPAEEEAPPPPAEPAEPSQPSEDAAQPEQTTPDWGGAEPAAAEPSAPAAEFESWPSQDTSPDEAPADEAPTDEAPAGEAPAVAEGPGETRAWPTEPPEAGTAPEESWPTSAPERGDEPVLEPARDDWSTSAEPEPAPMEPPPAEVEAYPSSESAVPPLAASAAAAGALPDTEATTAESTQCPRCGTENRPGLAFCRNCGQRLVAAGVAPTIERPGTPEGTTACPRCGTHNRTGVAFCQNCGANLRGTAPGYVPPAVASEGEAVPTAGERRGAVLGPVVLLIGVVGLITGYLLPFLYGDGSLFDRAAGAEGYGVAFWSGYPEVGAGLADQVYYGLAAPVPLFALILVVLAIAGFVRGAPGMLQAIGLVISLVWSVGLIVLFGVVEIGGNWGGDIIGVLRELTPAGIIFFLASLIVLIGTLTRFGRS
jgi:hypothetical protein